MDEKYNFFEFLGRFEQYSNICEILKIQKALSPKEPLLNKKTLPVSPVNELNHVKGGPHPSVIYYLGLVGSARSSHFNCLELE